MSGLGRFCRIASVGLVAGALSISAASAATNATVGIGGIDASATAPLTAADSVNVPLGASWNSPGGTRPTVNTTNPGQYVSPWGDDTKYWTVGNNVNSNNQPNPAVLTLASSQNLLTFLWGTVDTYNRIEFYQGGSGGTEIASVLGSDILAQSASIIAGSSNVLVGILVGGLFDTIKFFSEGANASQINAFEFSSLQFGSNAQPNIVPLPSALLLLGSVVGGLGLFGVRRRKSQAAA